MQSLDFNVGYKEFCINRDESKVIRFSPSDFNIIGRIKKAYDEIDVISNTTEDIELNNDGSPIDGLTESAKIMDEINKKINSQIDYIFDAPVSAMAFGNQSPLSMVNGQPLYVGFLNAIIPIIEKEVKNQQKESQKKIEKYTKVYHK